jgi:pSer/pThr/pTyr-binding forkhead associated (FHA) protein
MSDPLRKIEIQLENLFEKRTGVLSAQIVHAGKILARLIEALEERAEEGPGGRWIAPNVFRLKLGKRISRSTASVPDLPKLLSEKLEEHVRQSEMILLNPVRIEFEEDASLREESVRVEAEIDRSVDDPTGAVPLEPAAPIILPRRAFLIINGRRHFPLNRPVINIGRQLDNHLVLDDALISRRHAQLRARGGQYLLTDLGSKHGLLVNNTPTREWTLQPGDVFRLGNTEIIYGDEREESITQPIPPQDTDPRREKPTG